MTEAKKNPLLKKKRRTGTAVVWLDDQTKAEIKLRALSAFELDELRSAHPPTKEQKAAGASVNGDTFSPALFAACAVDPSFTLDEAKEMWESPDWSQGELGYLFGMCSSLCLGDADLPPSASA